MTIKERILETVKSTPLSDNELDEIFKESGRESANMAKLHLPDLASSILSVKTLVEDTDSEDNDYEKIYNKIYLNNLESVDIATWYLNANRCKKVQPIFWNKINGTESLYSGTEEFPVYIEYGQDSNGRDGIFFPYSLVNNDLSIVLTILYFDWTFGITIGGDISNYILGDTPTHSFFSIVLTKIIIEVLRKNIANLKGKLLHSTDDIPIVGEGENAEEVPEAWQKVLYWINEEEDSELGASLIAALTAEAKQYALEINNMVVLLGEYKEKYYQFFNINTGTTNGN